MPRGGGAGMSGAGFLLDLHRCVGCGACVLACRIENGRVETAAWRRVLPLNLRRHPAGPTYFLSVACHHCDEARMPEGVPVRRLRETRRWHRRPPRRTVPRLPLLRDDLPVRHADVRRGEGRDVEVPPVRAPRGRGPAAGVRGGVPDRGAAVRRRRRRRRPAWRGGVRAGVCRSGRLPAGPAGSWRRQARGVPSCSGRSRRR